MATNIDPVQSSLHFSAINTNNPTAEKSKKKTNVVASRFLDLVKQEESELSSEISKDLAQEIKGMTSQEAIVHLKDKVDIAGDKLKSVPTPDSFLEYKKALSNFVQYVLQHSYEVEKTTQEIKASRRNNYRKQTKEYVVVRVVDEKLEQLASELLYNHKDKIGLANRINEISGILVDLMW